MNAITAENRVPQIFDFEGHHVRTLLDEQGQPLFVGKDVAEILGYSDTDQALRKNCRDPSIRRPLSTDGGFQQMRVIYEPDVYRLIMRSRMPSAEKFERWVFEEVLPTIRRTGGYQFDKMANTETAESARPSSPPSPPSPPMLIGPLVFEIFEGRPMLRDQQLVKLLQFSSSALLRSSIRRRIENGLLADDDVLRDYPVKSYPRGGIPPMYYLLSYEGAQKYLADVNKPGAAELAIKVAQVCANSNVVTFPGKLKEAPLPKPQQNTTPPVDEVKQMEQAAHHVKVCMLAADGLGMEKRKAQVSCVSLAKEKTGFDFGFLLDAC